jgi:hypothetical protein
MHGLVGKKLSIQQATKVEQPNGGWLASLLKRSNPNASFGLHRVSLE